jgi:hypothetical protein
MSTPRRWASQTVEVGRDALRVFDAAWADGHINDLERHRIRKLLVGTVSLADVTDKSEALGLAVIRGGRDDEHFGRLIAAVQVARDNVDLPDEAA